MRKLLAVVLILAAAAAAKAQDEPEYRLELGGGAGLIAYTGDFNGNLLKGMQPWAALTARYHINPRMALMMDIGT